MVLLIVMFLEVLAFHSLQVLIPHLCIPVFVRIPLLPFLAVLIFLAGSHVYEAETSSV